MSKSKIAITLEEETLERLDELVAQARFPSRSRAIEQAVEEKLSRMARTRLAEECSKLDRNFERALAEEGLNGDLSQWPEY